MKRFDQRVGTFVTLALIALMTLLALRAGSTVN
jgi:hypothetical protein